MYMICDIRYFFTPIDPLTVNIWGYVCHLMWIWQRKQAGIFIWFSVFMMGQEDAHDSLETDNMLSDCEKNDDDL